MSSPTLYHNLKQGQTQAKEIKNQLVLSLQNKSVELRTNADEILVYLQTNVVNEIQNEYTKTHSFQKTFLKILESLLNFIHQNKNLQEYQKKLTNLTKQIKKNYRLAQVAQTYVINEFYVPMNQHVQANFNFKKDQLVEFINKHNNKKQILFLFNSSLEKFQDLFLVEYNKNRSTIMLNENQIRNSIELFLTLLSELFKMIKEKDFKKLRSESQKIYNDSVKIIQNRVSSTKQQSQLLYETIRQQLIQQQANTYQHIQKIQILAEKEN